MNSFIINEYEACEFFTSTDATDFLGRGSYASVRRCFHHELGSVVVKCFNLTGSDIAINKNSRNIEDEAKLLCRLKHKNIIGLLGITKWSTCYGVVMEEATGHNLEDLVIHEKHKNISWPLRLQFFKEIADGLEYLHYHDPQRSYVHGDLKLQNILLTDTMHIKIADFGAVNIIQASGASTASLDFVPSKQHTWLYSAPELLNCPAMRRTCAMDVYSYAMIGYEIITRHQVFLSSENANYGLIRHLIIENGQKPDQSLIQLVEKTIGNLTDSMIMTMLKQIMSNCWCHEPRDRMSIKDVKQSLNQDIVCEEEDLEKERIQKSRKLHQNPSRRITLKHFQPPFQTVQIENETTSVSIPTVESFTAMELESNKVWQLNDRNLSLDNNDNVDKTLIVEDDYNSTASPSTSQKITQKSALKQNTSHISPSYASLGNGSHFKAQDNTFSNFSMLKQSFENNELSFTDPEFSPFHFDSITDYPLLSSPYASSPGHYFDVIRSKSDNSNLLVRNRSNNVFKFPDLAQNSQQSCNSSNSSSSFNALRHYSDPQKLRSSPSSSHSRESLSLLHYIDQPNLKEDSLETKSSNLTKKTGFIDSLKQAMEKFMKKRKTKETDKSISSPSKSEKSKNFRTQSFTNPFSSRQNSYKKGSYSLTSTPTKMSTRLRGVTMTHYRSFQHLPPPTSIAGNENYFLLNSPEMASKNSRIRHHSYEQPSSLQKLPSIQKSKISPDLYPTVFTSTPLFDQTKHYYNAYDSQPNFSQAPSSHNDFSEFWPQYSPNQEQFFQDQPSNLDKRTTSLKNISRVQNKSNHSNNTRSRLKNFFKTNKSQKMKVDDSNQEFSKHRNIDLNNLQPSSLHIEVDDFLIGLSRLVPIFESRKLYHYYSQQSGMDIFEFLEQTQNKSNNASEFFLRICAELFRIQGEQFNNEVLVNHFTSKNANNEIADYILNYKKIV